MERDAPQRLSSRARGERREARGFNTWTRRMVQMTSSRDIKSTRVMGIKVLPEP